MEQRVQHLMHQLVIIGYRSHEINSIVKSANGYHAEMIGQLERYEQLGLHYLNQYSQ